MHDTARGHRIDLPAHGALEVVVGVSTHRAMEARKVANECQTTLIAGERLAGAFVKTGARGRDRTC